MKADTKKMEQRTAKGDLITVSPVNEQVLRAEFNMPQGKWPDVTIGDDMEIERIELDELSFTKGNHLHLKRQGKMIPYKVNLIWKEGEGSNNKGNKMTFLFYTTREALSTRFVLPMLGGDRQTFRWKHHLVQAFVGDATRDDFNDPYNIMLLYRFSGDESFRKLEDMLRYEPYFLEAYDPDRYHMMFAFQIPNEYVEDHEKFLEGKFSEFSEKYKERVLKFHLGENYKQKVGDNPIHAVLYREDWRRKYLEQKYDIEIPEGNELASVPEMKNEMYQEEYRYQDPIKDGGTKSESRGKPNT